MELVATFDIDELVQMAIHEAARIKVFETDNVEDLQAMPDYECEGGNITGVRVRLKSDDELDDSPSALT